MGKKREPTPVLKRILEADVTFTNRFCSWANNFTVFKSIRNHAKMLEVSCHGLPWLCGVLGFFYFTSSHHLQHMEINLLFGLLLDLMFVSFIKAATRRRRPVENKKDAFMMVGADKFSFPSGHASRAVFVSYFFIRLWPVSIFFVPALCAWSVAVAISRIVMRRHHVLDVLVGVCVGLLVGMLNGMLWISEDLSRYIVSYLSDEALEGPAYDV